VQGWLLAFGVIAWAIALVFGINHTDAAPSASYPASVWGADMVAAAAVLGFALAGGLCMLGAAVAGKRGAEPARSRGKTDFAAVLDQLRFTGILTDAEYEALKRKLTADPSAGTGA
jgi:hypothetical protein